MSDLISRQAAILSLDYMYCETDEDGHDWILKDGASARIEALPSAQSHNKLAKIADLVEGTIDHFDRDDAMDLLYQIKDVLK